MKMTVGELITQLTELDPSLPVILQKDAEGNGYSPLQGAEQAYYKAETTWMGEVYHGDDEDRPVSATPCVVLWPVN